MFKKIIIPLLCGVCLMQGCIKEQPLNIEVDMLEVTFADPAGVMNVVYGTSTVEIYVDPSTVDVSDFSLGFNLSRGASVAPDPASVSDYSRSHAFTVTSQNGEWKKTYTVAVVTEQLPTRYDFENWAKPDKAKYMLPYELDNNERAMNIWACGNAAFAFAVPWQDYTAYPTQPTAYTQSGARAALLITKMTGDLVKPIAAGSLFIGQFDPSKLDPLESTQFGLPFMKKPLAIKGWYKYRSGGLTGVSRVEDQCNIQAVLFKTSDQEKFLNGHTINTSAAVVARAELGGSLSTPEDGYVAFDLPFVYTEQLDMQLLAKGGYSLTVVFTSSRSGNVYDGAVGSELYVDNVEVVCE